MDSTCSERFLATSSDETECFLYPKRVRIESDQKSMEKEEQQKVEQSVHCVNSYRTSPPQGIYLSKRQNNWALENQSCDTARKSYMREFFHFQTHSNEGLLCHKISESKLSTKKWSPENEDQNSMQDDISYNACGYPLEKESPSVWSAPTTCKNPPQLQWNSSTEQTNKRNGDDDLQENSSVTLLSRDLFQVELSSRKSVTSKKWKRYQLLQIPFSWGNSSVFSHTEGEKNNFLRKRGSTEDKDYSSSDNETTAERDNKGKKNYSYVIPTLKPFKSIPLLEIPNFQLSSISNKINSKMPPTDLKEADLKYFKDQSSLTQSKRIDGVQKMSEIGKQKLKNDKSTVKAPAAAAEFKENSYPSIRTEECSALAERGTVAVTYFRSNSTDIDCNKIFAENYFKDKMLENSDGDNDQKSKIHICNGAKNTQNEKCVICNDLLKRMQRISHNENTGTFHIQTSIRAITEALQKNKLDIQCNSNTGNSLYEAELKLLTKEILDFKRYLTKNIIFESNCPRIIVRNSPCEKMSSNIFGGKEMFKLKFLFKNMFGWVRAWTESLYKDLSTCQDDSVAHWFHFCDTLNEQTAAQVLVKSNINRNHNNKTCICFLGVILKHQKAQSTIVASFFNSTNALLPTEGQSVLVEHHPLYARKQEQFNSFPENTLRQNTEFHNKNGTHTGFESSKFVESIGLELYNECQTRHFSRSLVEEKSIFQKRRTLFHNLKSGLCKGRHVRKHHLLFRGSEVFSTNLRSISRKTCTIKQILFDKCLILLQGTFDHFSLDSNITKILYLVGANLRFWSYFPAHSQLKVEKVNSRCTNPEISVSAVQQEKKPSEKFNSFFPEERFKAFPFVLHGSKKYETTMCRNCITSKKEVTNEVTYTVKNCLDTSSHLSADRKEYVNSKQLQINSHDFLSKKSCSIFDTYEKIPLTTDSEDFVEIPVVSQDKSIKRRLSEENTVTSSKEAHNLPAELNDVTILPEQSKTTLENYNSVFLQDSQTNKPGSCKKIDACGPHLGNEKTEDQNTHLNFENLFPRPSNVYQSITLTLDGSSFSSKDRVLSEGECCRSSSSADKQKQSEKKHTTVQYPSTRSPAMTETHLQLEAEETVPFSLQGHTQTNVALTLEKHHLEYGKEREEINDEQMHVTNESRCEIVMNDLIMSYSEEESKTFIAAEEKLKMHLSLINNGCLEDVKDKCLPLENKITYEFELKRKFDLVLEELHKFHEISKGNENNLSSLETNVLNNYCELSSSEGTDENVTTVSQKKTCISPPIYGTIKEQRINDTDESSLNKKKSNKSEEQEVSKEYCIPGRSSKELLHSPVAEGYSDAAYKKPYTWDPAFLSRTLLKDQNYSLYKEGGYFLSHEVIRVRPLKTCKGPIRIGLSRRARPKQLHPYLK